MDIKTINTDGKVEAWDLLQLAENLGIAERDFKLLMEAYRRRNLLDRDKKIVGIGTPKDYKSKFFRPLDKETVRNGYNSPYILSPSGKELMELIETFIPKPYKKENRDKLAELIRKF